MIVNPEIIANKYGCNKVVANYLMNKRGFPLLAKSGETYFFADTPELRECLKSLPIWISIFQAFK